MIWKPSRSLADQFPLQCTEQMGHLHPYNSNFEIKEAIQHAGIPIGLSEDTTGRFYRSNKQCDFENDFLSRDPKSPSDAFMRSRRINKVCLARFKMRDSLNGDFIVSVYRQKDDEDFKEDDSRRLEELAKFLPTLYQRLVASQLKSTIVKANEILRSRCSDLEMAAIPLNELCKELEDFFNFHEVSIFMRMHTTTIDKYHLIASTLPRSEMRKKVYRADAKDGLTGYILEKKDLIWFHDLHSFENPQRREKIETLYPGITWSDGADSVRLAKQRFGLADEDLPPPLSFIGVPVVGGNGNISGAIRASLGANPFHFLQEQVDAFQIIANEIGRWWDSTRELETNAVVTHQLRTPIRTAYKRLRQLSQLLPEQWNSAACKRLEEVAGEVSKARRVTNTMDSFGKIVSGEAVVARCVGVTARDARKSVIESALNVQTASEDQMNINFILEPSDWGETKFLWDEKYAHQCFDALIDNAFKYSEIEETVIIGCKRTTNYLIVSVTNTGRHIIRHEEVESCKRKDWRGSQTEGEIGRGLGLWITDHWMRAQNGRLNILPTTKSGETTIELWFERKLSKNHE